jgi:hypothetical protein
MAGDGDEGGFRDFLSLGRGEREGEALDRSLTMLASLSRNGLSMLAGGTNGGFSLSGMPGLRNLVGGGERKVSGGGFTGFYRASAPKTAWPSSMALRFGKNEETQAKADAGTAPSSQRPSNVGMLEQPLRTDVENLSPDECWRLILRLGKHLAK